MQNPSVEKVAILFAISKVKQLRNFTCRTQAATGFLPALFRARVAEPQPSAA